MAKKNMRSTSKTECRNNSSNSNLKAEKTNSNNNSYNETDAQDSN